MEINEIPDIFQSKIRIAIISCLMTGEKNFKEVKQLTGATDGNISVHISKLEEAGYIEIKKDFFNNKPRTTYSITAKGREDFIEYVNTLEQIVKQFGMGK